MLLYYLKGNEAMPHRFFREGGDFESRMIPTEDGGVQIAIPYPFGDLICTLTGREVEDIKRETTPDVIIVEYWIQKGLYEKEQVLQRYFDAHPDINAVLRHDGKSLGTRYNQLEAAAAADCTWEQLEHWLGFRYLKPFMFLFENKMQEIENTYKAILEKTSKIPKSKRGKILKHQDIEVFRELAKQV